MGLTISDYLAYVLNPLILLILIQNMMVGQEVNFRNLHHLGVQLYISTKDNTCFHEAM